MDNEPTTLGSEDGTIDVERMLVEPQDEHLSVDSVMCFDKNIPGNATDMEHVSCSSGGSDTGIAQQGKDVLNGEVLNATRTEVGYFGLDDDFTSLGEEYLLGVEFAESITNLDYGSSEGLQASVSDSQVQVSSAGSNTTSKSDLFRTVDVPGGQNNQFNVGGSNLSDIHNSAECKMLVGENFLFPPGSCTLQNISKLHNSSRSSFENVSSDENDSIFSPPKTEKGDVHELTGQDDPSNVSQVQEALAAMSVEASGTDVLPTQKRSRKPTLRYIDELADPVSIYSKKRREVSSTRKVKSRVSKDHKKCHMGPRAVKPLPEESSVIAIQVPFASLGNKECPDGRECDTVQRSNNSNSMTKSKGNYATSQNHDKADKCGTAVNPEKRGDNASIQKKMENMDDYATRQKRREKGGGYAISQKKIDGCVTETQLKKRNGYSTSFSHNCRRDWTTIALVRKKRDDCFTTSQNKRNKYQTTVHHKKTDDYPTAESSEEVSGRRKHHRLWTISEVRKLIEGVSQYGVGRWSRIKKLFFSTSAHRTSVDLKDKWRNLLKASGMQYQGNQQGEKKRNLAWRPLPKPILRRVCELATMYPYPKGQRPKVSDIHRHSPDGSTEITLSDYRRILRTVSGN